jgi:hypothetical protein
MAADAPPPDPRLPAPALGRALRVPGDVGRTLVPALAAALELDGCRA